MARWTPNEDAVLKAEWQAGADLKSVAIKLRRSKNSVIGRADRLGLPIHEKVACAARERPATITRLYALTAAELRERRRARERAEYQARYGVDMEYTEKRREQQRRYRARCAAKTLSIHQGG
jgi:hypothetical protein